MPKPKKRVRRNGAEAAEGTLEVDEEGNPVVGGEPAEAPLTLGEAIENVRASLTPFDPDTRRRIVRAANTFLK